MQQASVKALKPAPAEPGVPSARNPLEPSAFAGGHLIPQRNRKASVILKPITRVVALIVTFAIAPACRDTPEQAPSASELSETNAAPPPPIVVRDGNPNLIFTYRNSELDQAFKTATNIAEIPKTARKSVIVTDLSQSPESRQSGRYIFVADLTKPREDGTYPVAQASRYGFERGGAPAEGDEPAAPGQARGDRKVIVYSASWCGVCRQAKRALERWHVPFEEKDVEASRKAASELAAKAQARGVRPSGVPVIDVAGELLLGFDERALHDALERQNLIPRTTPTTPNSTSSP
ncbi:MAG: hypothetical protein H6729_07050 [Deltaproteobacteria bacterium]|nr:hypothetical protein [Deltaproteobacteria bacterium]